MVNEQDKIHAKNLIEEAKEILEPCIRCGMCKSFCGVFKTLKEEAVSPRGQAINLSDDVLSKLVFSCNLCKACEEKCPVDVKVCEAIRKAREALNLRGKGLKGNDEMIENVRRAGNPFGGKKADKDKLYCC